MIRDLWTFSVAMTVYCVHGVLLTLVPHGEDLQQKDDARARRYLEMCSAALSRSQLLPSEHPRLGTNSFPTHPKSFQTSLGIQST
eukprot:1549907-Amphidinium_carterae.1